MAVGLKDGRRFAGPLTLRYGRSLAAPFASSPANHASLALFEVLSVFSLCETMVLAGNWLDVERERMERDGSGR